MDEQDDLIGRDDFAIGKDTLGQIADLGASRAGRLVVEIEHNLWKLDHPNPDVKYLANHLHALFTEFRTGREYDLPYYNKPEEQYIVVDEAHEPCEGCEGCPDCWDKARQDLLDAKKIKWWHEDPPTTKSPTIYIVGITLTVMGMFMAVGILVTGTHYLLGD